MKATPATVKPRPRKAAPPKRAPKPAKTDRAAALKGAPATMIKRALPDFADHLQRARTLAASLGEQAEAEQDAKRRVGLARQYREMLEQVRRLELAAPKILLEQGRVVDRALAESQVATAATLVRNELLAMPAKVGASVVGLTTGQVIDLLRAEIQEALRHLSSLTGRVGVRPAGQAVEEPKKVEEA